MPMIKPASITSRKTMTSAPNMPLFRAHDAFRFAGNDLLDFERAALELLGACILVGDVNRHAFACRHADFLRLEFVVANDDVEFLGDGMHARHTQCRQCDRQYRDAHHSCRSPTPSGDMKGFAGRDASPIVLNCSNVWAQTRAEKMCCGGKFACHAPPRRGIQQTLAFSP